MKKHSVILLVFIVSLSIVTLSTSAYSIEVFGKYYNLIDIKYLKEFNTVSGILFPRIALPAFVTPNSEFNIVLYAPKFNTGVDRIYLYKGGLEKDLEIISSSLEGNKLILNVSLSDIKPGLYTLVAVSNNEKHIEYNSVAIKNSWNYPLKIFRLSDTHYDNRISAIRQRENFLGLIWRANFINPDFIVVTGDVMNTAVEENYKMFIKDVSNMLRVPIVLVPGNHDHHFKEDLFTKYIGASNVSLNIGPLHLILVDTGPNGMNGWISNEQIRWLKDDLKKYGNMEVKIMMSHHPFSLLEESERSNKTGLDNLLENSDVDLILHGHMHYVMIEKDLHPLRITDPNAYEGGQPYTAFRIIYIKGPHEIDWKYNGSEDPYPLFNLTVNEYQIQNGSNSGYSLFVSNKLDIDLKGYIGARIKKSNNLLVKGVNEDSLNITEFPDYIEITGEIIVKKGEEINVKIYGIEDNEPPTLKDIDIEKSIGKSIREHLYIYLWDSISGIKDVSIKYTLDNETWSTAKVIRLTTNLFYTSVSHSKDNGFGLKLEATDVEGNVYSSGFLNYSLTVKEVKPPMEGGEPGTSNLMPYIIGIVAVLVAIPVIYIILRRR